MTDELPKRLKNDAIVEAVLEVRFEPDPTSVIEIVFGRFADAKELAGFRHARLPTADIPEAFRRTDPNLMYQPSIELTAPDGAVSFRIGPQVAAYSRRGQYPGWTAFGGELRAIISHLFRIMPSVRITRIGLRYINALRSNLHQIGSIRDLDIKISVADEIIDNSLNLNFKDDVGTNLESMSRIASVDLAQGTVPLNSTVIIDIDVYTGQTFATQNETDVISWIEAAHTREKQKFFKLLGKDATERLKQG